MYQERDKTNDETVVHKKESCVLMLELTCKIYTVCVIQNGSKILLMNRQHDNFPGFIAPGGKVEFPESPVEGAIREVKEETGLTVSDLVYKGLAEYVNPFIQERYMIFNYITQAFEGELIHDHPEGRSEWVDLSNLDNFPMQKSFRERIPLFFKEGTFEIHRIWKENREYDEIVRAT